MDPVADPHVEDVAWLTVDDPSAVGRARRAAEQLAATLGLRVGRVADVGLAVTEIASNVHRHGGGGAVALRAVRGLAGAAVEVVAIDGGPGIPDLHAARRDGSSAAGTLGIGLGAIGRLADFLDISSEPGRGTVLVARFDGPRLDAGDHPAPAVDAAGITRALSGESLCGDAYAVRTHEAGVSFLVCDGSGHGPLAASAAREAVRTFEDPLQPASPPAAVLRRIHGVLAGTRGAAASVAELDAGAGIVRFAGIGNVSGAVLDDGGKRSMVSVGGVAGYRDPIVRTFEYPLPPDAVVVMHSDGVRSRWAGIETRGLLDRTPLLLAAVLLRDAGVRRDDACVLVGRAGP
ncbi:ATP-binding SpoIIE family protein phosphatase [Pseudonocardia sp. MH-G8]|uniref:ATP-binding SpoIIE family protein phosphatase n=1 Tax=Pseudonocardia sp. MH-G8 TaxID=1854588 RepID=UPI000BA06A5B|nr:ATP-binding SpoIIE family protein phosphatase [Pseudonocardia sp. MH-G8]OZM78294.1 transcriptional regulator [Pseudonocardia sp. MH-G8]